MLECFRCGISEEKVKLYSAISERGVVKICRDCNSIERLPIIKKPSDSQIEDSKRQQSVRDMLSGINKNKLLAGREVSLRELVDRNLKERKEKQPSDLIDNFHWTIQRIRRNRKITREQFSKGIGEPESKVRMIEQGILPDNDYKIINKIESYLGVSLRKPGTSGFPDTSTEKRLRIFNPGITTNEPPKKLGFDRDSTSRLKIDDLREMKKKQEDEGHQGSPYTNPPSKKGPVDSWEEERSQDDEKFLDETEEDFFDED
jgi:ribosome-binding protein aMBF1 (putative translation factor)